MKRSKKIIIVLILALIVAVVGVMAWVVFEKPEFLSTDYTETAEADGILEYGGKKYRYKEYISNYLFLGIDKRTVSEEEVKPGEAGQADAILLVSYDQRNGTVQCVSIPRDTMTIIRTFSQDGTDLGKSKDHLNIQYAFGDGREKSCRLMMEAVEELFYDISIQGYCALSMDGIPMAVDAVGEVEVVVPDDTLSEVNSEFQKGNTAILTKDNVEQFVRYRDTDVRQSAMERGNRQKVFVKAFAQAAKEKSATDGRLVTTMYENLQPYMVTNMGNDVFAKLLQAKMESGEMFAEVPGERVDGADFDEYKVDRDALYQLVLKMFYEEVQEDS